MHSIELKVFGQTLLLNVAEEKDQYYIDIAEELNNVLEEFSKKSQLRSDIKVAVSVAYKLLLENKQQKEFATFYEDIGNKIDSLIVKLDNK